MAKGWASHTLHPSQTASCRRKRFLFLARWSWVAPFQLLLTKLLPVSHPMENLPYTKRSTTWSRFTATVRLLRAAQAKSWCNSMAMSRPAARSWFGRKIRSASSAFVTIGATERQEFSFVTEQPLRKSKCRSYRYLSCHPLRKQMTQAAKEWRASNRFAGWSQAICFWKVNYKPKPVHGPRFRSRWASNKVTSQWFERVKKRRCRSWTIFCCCHQTHLKGRLTAGLL